MATADEKRALFSQILRENEGEIARLQERIVEMVDEFLDPIIDSIDDEDVYDSLSYYITQLGSETEGDILNDFENDEE